MNSGNEAANRGEAARGGGKDARVFRPHDLLWVTGVEALGVAGPLPEWASREWIALAPVVVRRDKAEAFDRIPVGLRGPTRSQRFGTYLDRGAVARCATPEMLVPAALFRKEAPTDEIPAFEALLTLTPLLNATGLIWGPTGSAGFSVASGLPVLRQDSDLDLVVRAPAPLSGDLIESLCAMRRLIGCRLDIQIDTGRGGFSFAELAQGNRRVLLKTDSGPLLTDDPWHPEGRPDPDLAHFP